MPRPVLVTPPAAAPVSLVEAKAQLRVDGDDENDLVQGLIDAAVSHLDGYSGILGRCLVTQTWRQDFPGWGRYRLPFPDVRSVALTYRDTAGAEQAVAADDVWFEDQILGPTIGYRAGWLAPMLLSGGAAPVTVTFVAGYGTPADVPAAIRRAILMLVGHWYANREAVVTGTIATELPLAVKALIAPFRTVTP